MFWAIQQALNRDAKIRQERDRELLEAVRTKGVVVLDGVRLVADPPRMGGGVSVTNPRSSRATPSKSRMRPSSRSCIRQANPQHRTNRPVVIPTGKVTSGRKGGPDEEPAPLH